MTQEFFFISTGYIKRGECSDLDTLTLLCRLSTPDTSVGCLEIPSKPEPGFKSFFDLPSRFVFMFTTRVLLSHRTLYKGVLRLCPLIEPRLLRTPVYSLFWVTSLRRGVGVRDEGHLGI